MPRFNALLRAALGVATALACLGTSGSAWAHAHLLSETPAANSLGASPQDLRLKFSEGLELKFTAVVLTDPSGAEVKHGALALDPTDKTKLIVPLTDALVPGRYAVAWHATATDTHKTQGTYSFTVKP